MKGEPNFLVATSSFEERCLGVTRRIEGVSLRCSFLLKYPTISTLNTQHFEELKGRLEKFGPSETLPTNEGSGPEFARQLIVSLHRYGMSETNGRIFVDITTLSKWHILELFETLDRHRLLPRVTALYTEPAQYANEHGISMSRGIQSIEVIPGFVGFRSLSLPVLLVMFLGYERDRSFGLYEEMDPNRVQLFVSEHGFHGESKSLAEDLNKPLIELVGSHSVTKVSPRDPWATKRALNQLLDEGARLSSNGWNCYVSPIGTKSQALGLFLYWRERRGQFSIIYPSPQRRNTAAFTSGLGQSWIVLSGMSPTSPRPLRPEELMQPVDPGGP